jgi:hypothetical protein
MPFYTQDGYNNHDYSRHNALTLNHETKYIGVRTWDETFPVIPASKKNGARISTA